MQLQLTDEEATELRDLLGRCLGDMKMEISHTDNPEYRRRLRARRDRLMNVFNGLRSPEPVA